MQTKASETQPNYIDLIRSEFLRRQAKNKSFSLNAFARQLEIDQSLFSKILSGKKKISARMARELLLKAGVAEKRISAAVNNFSEVAEKEFEFLSAWLPFAILELLKIDSFQMSQESEIAKKFSVHKAEVQNAIRLLDRFGYIEILKGGQIALRKPNNDWSNTNETSIARKNLQRKYLELSQQALNEIPYELRAHGSLTIAVNRSQIPEIKEKMNRFRMELGRSLQKQKTLNEVYQITMSLFPLTRMTRLSDDK